MYNVFEIIQFQFFQLALQILYKALVLVLGHGLGCLALLFINVSTDVSCFFFFLGSRYCSNVDIIVEILFFFNFFWGWRGNKFLDEQLRGGGREEGERDKIIGIKI